MELKTEKRKVDKSPDKREMQFFRETLKTIFVLVIGFTLACPIYYNYYENIPKPATKVVKVLCTKKHIEPTKPKKSLKDLCVVIKVSKDVKKYFISYKKFYTETDYKIVVDEISFSEYMLLNSKDTLTTTRFNIK